MLTIGQLADYVRVTPRAIRHYHALGLLPEPPRTAGGYRSYGAQDVIDLQRIKTLADAGVPLARIQTLTHAGPDALRAAIEDVDASLQARISDLQRTRQTLAALADSSTEPFLPPELSAMHDRMRELGVSERTLAMEREAWILIQVLFPEVVLPWLRSQTRLLDDPDYAELYLLTDSAFDWPPDDPRIEQAAQRTIAWIRAAYADAEPADSAQWGEDPTAYRLVTQYRRNASPGWRRLMERVEELAAQDVRGTSEPG